MVALNIQPGTVYQFEFTNFKGELRTRRVIIRSMQWGETPWHTEVQFFVEAFDLDKQEVRSFPIRDINVRSFRRITDEELDVILTTKVRDAIEEYKQAVSLDAGDAVG